MCFAIKWALTFATVCFLVQTIIYYEEYGNSECYQCNVSQYSFFIFEQRVLLFAFCVVQISAWMVLQSKQSCFIFYIFTL